MPTILIMLAFALTPNAFAQGYIEALKVENLTLPSQTASRVPYLDSNKKVVTSSVTATELGYLSGVSSALQTQIDAKLTNPLTTNGDLVTRASGVPARLGIGTSGYILTSNGSAPTWAAAPVSGISALTGDISASGSGSVTATLATVGPTKGGTGLTSYTTGDLLYASASNTLGKLGLGTTAQVLTVDTTGLPAWKTASGGGGKNYLGTANGVNANGDFELGATTKWSLGVTGTLTNGIPTGTPTFGSGASGNLSLAMISTGNQLAGTWSLGYISSAATTAGNMVASDAFTIDKEDRAKPMSVSFSYEAALNPSNMNLSGTNSNSYAWAIWDATNSSWIPPTSGGFCMTQGSGVGTCTGEFQTSASGTSYRFVFYNANATSGAANVALDSFKISRTSRVYGSPQTDWVYYTPTIVGYGTVSNVSFRSRRNGPDLEVVGRFTSGTPAASLGTITLGYQGVNGAVKLDPNLLPNSAVNVRVGDFSIDTVADHTGTILAYYGSPTLVYMGMTVPSGSVNQTTAHNGNSIIGIASNITVQFKVPIEGWSSNTQMSSDADGRAVVFYGSSAANTVFSGTTITMAYTAGTDTHGAYDGTNTYRIPVSGFYKIAADTTVYQNSVGGGNSIKNILVNGSPVKTNYVAMPTQGDARVHSSSWEGRLNAGDLITVQMTNSSGAMQILGSTVGGQHSLLITREGSSGTIAATETIAARYQSSAGAAINNSATILDFPTKTFDTHNAVTTGASWKFTAPANGLYEVKFAGGVGPFTCSAGQGFGALIYKNGSSYSRIGSAGTCESSTANSYKNLTGSEVVKMNAGDYIDIRTIKDSGVTASFQSSADTVYINIRRVGN